jgi:hypothetical protein
MSKNEKLRKGINGAGAIGIEDLIYSVALGQPVVKVNDIQGRDYVHRQLLSKWRMVTGMQIHHDASLFKISDYEAYKMGTDSIRLIVEVVEADPFSHVGEGQVYARDVTFPVSAEKNPHFCRWNKEHAVIVDECTGMFTSPEDAARHFAGGAKLVIVAAPPSRSGEGASSLILGVNHGEIPKLLEAELHTGRYDGALLFNGSRTTRMLAIVLKAFEDARVRTQRLDFTSLHGQYPPSPESPEYQEIYRSGGASLKKLFPGVKVSQFAVGAGELEGSLAEMVLDCCSEKPLMRESVNDILRNAAFQSQYGHRMLVLPKDARRSPGMDLVRKREYSAIIEPGSTQVEMIDAFGGEPATFRYRVTLASLFPTRTGQAVEMARASILAGRALGPILERGELSETN